MPDFITIVYLTFMFVALYFFSFFIILTIKNNEKLFSYPKPEKKFSISVLTPAHNEEESIQDTVEHIMALEYPKNKMEVIVLNDGSTDNTSKIVRKLMKRYKNLKLIDNEKNLGKARSLNIGIKKAKGELIAVVDSDSFPSKSSLKKLSGFFSNQNMGAVTSFVRVRNKEKNRLAKIQSIEYLIMGWSRKLLDFIDSVYVTNGPLSLYRKKYILEVGGFDPATVTEDIDITWNMLYHGYKTGMCLDADVSTVAPNNYKVWFKQRMRWGMGGLQAISKYRKMFFRKGMFGAFILPFVSFSIIMSLLTFIFSIYLVFKFLAVRFLTVGYSITTDSAIFKLQEINLYPSVIIFFFDVLFTLSTIYSWYVLNKTKYEQNITTKKFFNILFYTIVYLSVYPIVWFASIYKFARKDLTW
ncbi:MAG: glycosyltransferase [Nanoarchaeota archaeon]|nr:glycosyltransferase [Nanoarchaeota archaeon]